MSPYEQAQEEIAILKARVADLQHQIATEHAGLLASIKLERDMYAQRYEMKNRACNDLMAERMKLVAENRRLQNDRMLLDWLSENNYHITPDVLIGSSVPIDGWAFYCPKTTGFMPVRERLTMARRHSLGIEGDEE
jgi:hypothetical protein